MRAVGVSAISSRYTRFNPAYLLEVHQRERTLLQELKRVGVTTLEDMRILDIGCGSGTGLLTWALIGAHPAHLHGIDLNAGRIDEARRLYPTFDLKVGNATALPWPSNYFHLVSQFTTFSSILDPEVRREASREVARVLRSDGHFLWYDF